MGRVYLEHLGGSRLFSCINCDTFLTNIEQLKDHHFHGVTGPAILFNKVVNLKYGETEEKVMVTGLHKIRKVFCKSCDARLGWFYEFAYVKEQEYKEGKVVLERSLIYEHPPFRYARPNAGTENVDERPGPPAATP